jgi:hypothetical protein
MALSLDTPAPATLVAAFLEAGFDARFIRLS